MRKKITPELSVIVLCYRSEEHFVSGIDVLRKLLKQEKIDFELILVANYDAMATQDRTPEIARAIAAKDKRCICIAGPKNGRMGWDLRLGLNVARGRFITFIDGDGQALSTDVLRLYALACTGSVDLCKIYRARRMDSVARKIISRIYNLLFRIFFPSIHSRDINAKPKLLTREAYANMQLTSNDWFADAEIMLEARRLALRVVEISGETVENTWRKSFIGFSAVLEFLKNILVYRIRYWFFR